MTKQELIEENEKLLEQLKKVEKELDARADGYEISKLYEIRNILSDEIYFYRQIITNLTQKEKENEL